MLTIVRILAAFTLTATVMLNTASVHAQSCCPPFQTCSCSHPDWDCCDVYYNTFNGSYTYTITTPCDNGTIICDGIGVVQVERHNCGAWWGYGQNCLNMVVCDECKSITSCSYKVTVLVNLCDPYIFPGCSPSTEQFFWKTYEVLCPAKP